jgi:hypothetical protein
LRAVQCGLLKEKASRARWIQHSVIDDAQATSHSRTQIRFGFFNARIVEDFDANSALAVEFLFAVHFSHFLFVSGEPKRAARIVFDIGRKFRNELLPESAREMGKRKLGFRIVHDDYMSHTGSGRAARDWAAIQHENLQPSAGAFGGASSSDNSGAHNDKVEGFGHAEGLKALKR